MADRLRGKVALVTGGSRGIGRGIALEMAKEGADIVVNYRREEESARETAKEIEALGRKALVAKADVVDFEAVSAMMERAAAEFGGIDVLVANSGVASRPAPISKMPLEEWRRVVGINLDGVFHTLRAGIPKMRKGGTVLTISSVGADLCTPFGAPYYASKAAVNALTKVAAKELAPEGIRVNCIASGWVLSDMGERMGKALGEDNMLAGIPLGRGGRPDEIGKLAVFLASEDAAWITGKIYRIDGGAVM